MGSANCPRHLVVTGVATSMSMLLGPRTWATVCPCCMREILGVRLAHSVVNVFSNQWWASGLSL